jgi:hypothetical protein
MYISDKNLINILILPYFLATLAEKGIKGKGHDFTKCVNRIISN